MRIALTLLCLSSFAGAGLVQGMAQAPDAPVEVRTLTIVSKDLPDSEREEIVGAIQGKTYPLREVSQRVRQHLRDDGYAEARTGAPQVAAGGDVTVEVTAGAQYRLDAIRFENAAAFPADQLRRQFAIESGALFNATAIGKGLDQLKKLYAAKGYASFGAIPKLQMDEAHHTATVVIAVNEGKS